MTTSPDSNAALFIGVRLAARGALATVARAAHAHRDESIIILDEATGRSIDLDLRGSTEDVVARLIGAPPSRPPRGRPKLGVTAREVTLLPRHWEWLAGQPGGASAALRRLVDQARRDTVDADALRRIRDATYQAMTTLAGDLPGYEEAARALFANDKTGFEDLIAAWPRDISVFLRSLNANAIT